MSDQKTVLVSACGSSIGLEILRSLRLASRLERVIGTEISWWGKQVAERYCDQVFLVPQGDEAGYLEALRTLIHDQQVDLAFVNTDSELERFLDNQDRISIPVSCPKDQGLRACLDKEVLYARLGDLMAGTMVVSKAADIQFALERFGTPVWLRCAKGPRGRGSIMVETAEEGEAWIHYWQRRRTERDAWLAHEFLPGKNLNWTSIWKDGELLASSAGERLKYFMEEVAVSGVTGNVSHCRLVDTPGIDDIGVGAIRRADSCPHGIYSVDLRESREGIPLVTEINGRLAFRPLLYTRGGADFSSMFIDAFLYGKTAGLPRTNAASVGLEMIRGMDIEPLFRHESS